MLTHRQTPYQTPSDSIVTSSANPLSSFYLCEPSSFHSKCIITIRGSRKEHDIMYIVEDGTDGYTFSVSGKVEAINLEPETILLSLNQIVPKQYLTTENLIGKQINNGDVLYFFRNHSAKVQPLTVYAEIVLQCPIVKNE